LKVLQICVVASMKAARIGSRQSPTGDAEKTFEELSSQVSMRDICM
jgi:hypothetical protein